MTARARFLLLFVASAILILGALHRGDLPGYDDAQYSTEAKNVVHSGDWLNPAIRGGTAMDHPPLFVWMQALLFSIFGISDAVAKAPAALCAIATVLLVYWLARRLLHDSLAASVAMFVMLATPYFIKYAGHAMTDVPTTFFFVLALCAWCLRHRGAGWYFAAGAFTAMALFTRGLIGVALLGVFTVDVAIDLIANAESPRRALSLLTFTALVALAPLVAWYAHDLLAHPEFVATHQRWLETEVYGPLNPPWRRYTGAFEYAFMLLKSYWPWLPALVAGLVLAIRERRRELYPLVSCAAIVFILCAITRSRVLRYMLPAYPAFSILAAAAIAKFIPRRFLQPAMNWIPVPAVAAGILIAVFWKPTFHATEIEPLARAASNPHGQRVAFYDKGDPRWDETNQLEWYGDCVPRLLPTRADLNAEISFPSTRWASTLIIDKPTYDEAIRQIPHSVLAENGRLIYVRLQ
jgi:4-amino-4-deoxy-L-arabinose transferase-like glycosyltransferase